MMTSYEENEETRRVVVQNSKTSAVLMFHARRSHEAPERSKYDLEKYEE